MSQLAGSTKVLRVEKENYLIGRGVVEKLKRLRHSVLEMKNEEEVVCAIIMEFCLSLTLMVSV